jgi:hypothetical protein
MEKAFVTGKCFHGLRLAVSSRMFYRRRLENTRHATKNTQILRLFFMMIFRENLKYLKKFNNNSFKLNFTSICQFGYT